jgi:GT2 family glycosyltransferase
MSALEDPAPSDHSDLLDVLPEETDMIDAARRPMWRRAMGRAGAYGDWIAGWYRHWRDRGRDSSSGVVQRLWWAAKWMKHAVLLTARWAMHFVRTLPLRLFRRAWWAARWTKHWILFTLRWGKHWILFTLRWGKHWILFTWRWGKHWVRWTLRWSIHWMIWSARWSRYWLLGSAMGTGRLVKAHPTMRPRLGMLEHHAPRPLDIPARYTCTPLPRRPQRISIVTPSFNQAHMIERTLDSVLDQHYPDLEFIVQDGASTDGTPDVLERYDDRLTFWESVPDNGQTDAINRGFARSTGSIMAYLNSDDLLLPGSLAYIARFFEQHPSIDAVYGHRALIDENDREIGRWIMPPHDDDVLSWADFVPQETLFWRREAWARIGGFDDTFRFAMDWDFLVRLRDSGARFKRLPRLLGAFRIHEQQKTSAVISDVGMQEMTRLRRRCLGHEPNEAEIYLNVAPYLGRHMLHHVAVCTGMARL